MTLIIAFSFLSVKAQTDLQYYLPMKSFRVTVNYTEITKKRIQKSTTASFNSEVAKETIIVVKDDVTVEEIVYPDYANPIKLALPKISSAGASFNYSFQWSDNGLGSSFNAAREPVVVSVISGAVGLISSGVAVFAKAAAGLGAAPGAAPQYEEVTEEKKFKIVKWLNLDCTTKSGQLVLDLPSNYQSAVAKPHVVLDYSEISSPSAALSSGSGPVVAKAKTPANYLIEVSVTNTNQPTQVAISSNVQVPQCGKDTEYKFDLMKGKRTISFEIDPSSGSFKKVEYKKESNWKASQESINGSIEQIAAMVDHLKSLKDDKQFESINSEIDRLKKENEKLQEIKNKMELEKAIAGN